MISAATSRRRSSGGRGVDRALVEVARAPALELDQPPHRLGDHAGREIVDRAAAGRQIVERQVDAAALEVVLDVAEDVRELQRDAQVQRVVARALVPAPERS